MKRYFVTIVIAVMVGLSASAQTSLAGRTYYNANILADEINKETKDIDKKMSEARAKAIADLEKKKGRKATESEKADIDKQVLEARKLLESLKKGVVTKISVEFKTDKNVVMTADMKISEELMKKAGVGWLKRKAMKAALALAPKSSKGTYVIRDNQVIITDDDETDTLRLSDDGKYLYGKFDKKTDFRLTRTK